MLGFGGALEAQQTNLQRAQAPTDSDMYCAGFFAPQPIAPYLVVLSNEDAGFKNEYVDRDVIYLNKGRQVISAPGGQYLMVRPVKDLNPKEHFPGQRELIAELGTLYAEVGRIQVRVVHEASATAEVLKTCEPIVAGDIAIPLPSRSVPTYRAEKITDRFAAPSGKPTGLVVAAKEFQSTAGEGNIVYLNVGRNQGAAVGSYLRVFRPYAGGGEEEFQEAAGKFLTEIRGVSIGRTLTTGEVETLPRKVIGEIVLLSVEERSSTGIITFAREEVAPGDSAELE